MRLRIFASVIASLALSACGDDQTVQEPTSPRTMETTQSLTTPSAAAAPAASSQSGPSTAAAGSGASGETTGTVGTPPSTTTIPNTTAALSGSAAGTLEAFQGRTFSVGPISIQLYPDNSFVMNEVEGDRKVEGRYAYQDGIVTFSEPKGDIGPAQFPMRCRLQPGATGEFRFAENEGSCTRLKDLTFKPASG
jgi:hypothetical protein